MVGVSRSNGCKACVQRRIKCDRTQPTCKRCKKRGLQCPGYGFGLRFQDEGPKLRLQYEKRAASQSETRMEASSFWLPGNDTAQLNNPPALLSPASENDPPNNISDNTGTQDATIDETVHLFDGKGNLPQVNELSQPRGNFLPLLQFVLSPSAAQSQFLSLFISAISPASSNPTDSLPHYSSWLKQITALPPSSTPPSLNYAIRAMTLSHFGRVHQLPFFIDCSRQQYGLALSHLGRTISSDPNGEGLAATTVSATMLLSFYEAFHPIVTSSWVRHATGVAALLRARGPTRTLQSSFDRTMFLAYRMVLIIEAFHTQTPCFLDQPAWRAVSKTIHAESEPNDAISNISEEFIMAIAKLPSLAHDAQNVANIISETGQNCLAFIHSISSRASAQRLELKSLFADLIGTLRDKGEEPTMYSTTDNLNSIFPYQFHYGNILVASIYCGYWTCLTLINLVCLEMENKLAATSYSSSSVSSRRTTMKENPMGSCSNTPPTFQLSPSVALALQFENIGAVHSCCQSFDYMSGSVFTGPFLITFALRVGLIVITEESERFWIKGKLKELGKNLGMAGVIEEEVERGEGLNFSPNHGVGVHRSSLTTREELAQADMTEAAIALGNNTETKVDNDRDLLMEALS
ncbi:MAG: hypothetical protein M1834_008222 [Cirrosporium novae-zelandiae]|nr:MAG: hypothetical protein M1834_008222 [Cirrosporium novae-zelandiae]